MHILLGFGKSIVYILFLITVGMFVGYVFPQPLSFLHVGTISIIMYILLKERGRVIWYMFIYYFVQEILFPGDIYGAVLFAGTMSAIIAYWSHKFILTNRSIYTGLSLGILTLVSYRLVWFLYQAAVVTSGGGIGMPDMSLRILAIEVITTEAVLLMLMLLFLKKHDIA